MDDFFTHRDIECLAYGPPLPLEVAEHRSIYPENLEPSLDINMSNIFIDNFFNISITLKGREALTIKEMYDMDNQQLGELLQSIQSQPSSDQQVMLVLLINNIQLDRRITALEKN